MVCRHFCLDCCPRERDDVGGKLCVRAARLQELRLLPLHHDCRATPACRRANLRPLPLHGPIFLSRCPSPPLSWPGLDYMGYIAAKDASLAVLLFLFMAFEAMVCPPFSLPRPPAEPARAPRARIFQPLALLRARRKGDIEPHFGSGHLSTWWIRPRDGRAKDRTAGELPCAPSPFRPAFGPAVTPWEVESARRRPRWLACGAYLQ